MMDNLPLYRHAIMITLKRDPVKLKKKEALNSPVLNIPIKNTLKIAIKMDSLGPYRKRTITITILAIPNFIPGIIPLKIGKKLSIMLSRIERARNIDNRVNFLYSIYLTLLQYLGNSYLELKSQFY